MSECREQLEEAHKQHESMVKVMKQERSPEDKKSSHLASPSKLEALQGEMARMEEDQAEVLRDLRQQLEMSQERVTELELQVKLASADAEREGRDLRAQISDLDG